MAGEAAGNAETNAFTASAVGRDRRVDAHDVAIHIDQWSAAVARIDCRIRLHEILIRDGMVIRQRQVTTTFRAHDAHRDGLTQSKRAADCQNITANIELSTVAPATGVQSGFAKLQNGQICFFVAIDPRRIGLTTVRQAQFNVFQPRSANHMIVRDDEESFHGTARITTPDPVSSTLRPSDSLRTACICTVDGMAAAAT